jgi:hypothetical protein
LNIKDAMILVWVNDELNADFTPSSNDEEKMDYIQEEAVLMEFGMCYQKMENVKLDVGHSYLQKEKSAWDSINIFNFAESQPYYESLVIEERSMLSAESKLT